VATRGFGSWVRVVPAGRGAKSDVSHNAKVRKGGVAGLGILNWCRKIWGQSIEERAKQLERQPSLEDSPEDKAARQVDEAREQPDRPRDTKATDRT
jgi:hypothetical protein